MTCRRTVSEPAPEHREKPPSGHALMAVAPAERALLLLIRARGHGELTIVFRGGLPTYAKQVEQCIHLGQWQGGLTAAPTEEKETD